MRGIRLRRRAWMYRFESNAASQHPFDATLDDFEDAMRIVRFQVPNA